MIESTISQYRYYTIKKKFQKLMELITKSSEEDLEDSDMDIIYDTGYYAFNLGMNEFSSKLFEFLSARERNSSKYWRARGAVYQNIKCYENAIECYDKAITFDETEAVSIVFRAECLIMLGQIEAGLDGLLTLDRLEPSFDNEKMKIRAQKLLEIFDKALEKEG